MSKQITLILWIVFVVNVNSKSDQFIQIRTKNGLIRGLHETSQRKHVDFYAFRGIPYAKPPLDELRFKAPEPIGIWEPNIFDAFRYGNNCIQPNEFNTDPHSQHEDCLFLNVFVPADIEPNDRLAVLFFIHGGGFTEGSGNNWLYGADFLIENRVILVTSNYRLGVLGFLSLDLPEYSGNMGLKDQQLALKWTHQNIDSFGGDNTRITIFGHSSGAASTHYHVLSTESRDYFRNAIVMSGSALHYSALSPWKNHIDLAFEMINKSHDSTQTLDALVKTLKTLPAQDFKLFSKQKSKIRRVFGVTFGPVIEGSNAIRPFLIEMPEQTYDNTNIDKNILFGITSQESLGMDELNEHLANIDGLKEEFLSVLPFRGMNLSTDSPKSRELISEIRDFYFKNVAIDKNAKANYIALLSDINIVYLSSKAAKMHTIKSSGLAFFYQFAVESKLNLVRRGIAYSDIPGAAHGDELCYLFRCASAQSSYDEITTSENDEQSKISDATIDVVTQLFSNFAKYGKPMPNNNELIAIPAFERNRTHFGHISNHGLQIEGNLHKEAIDFWAHIEQRAFDP